MTEQSLVEKGFYGDFGGSYIPEDLQKVLEKLAETFEKYKDDPDFKKEYQEEAIKMWIKCII